MAAKQGDTVKVHYRGTLGDGTEFDNSEGREPLEFTLGEGQVIPGFEKAIEGMEEGEQKTFTISSDDAYGPREDERIMNVSRSAFPDDMELEVGMQFQAAPPGAPPMLMKIVALTEEEVTVDANHPLAGEDLTFEIELTEIVPGESPIITP